MHAILPDGVTKPDVLDTTRTSVDVVTVVRAVAVTVLVEAGVVTVTVDAGVPPV